MKSRTFVIFFACIILIAAAATSADQADTNLKKAWPKIFKALNSGDPETMAGIYAPDAVMIMPGESAPVKGRAALLQYYKNILRAVPDFGFKTVSIHYAGDTIIGEYIFSGTFSGPLAGPEGDIQPTGNHFEIASAMFLKITPDGLIAEDRSYYDTLDHMKQMGLLE